MINWEETQWEDRADYLADLVEDYNLPAETVDALADILGDTELFDGLLIALEDAESEF